jgi:MarR family transcriptional repressor of emrRAB
MSAVSSDNSLRAHRLEQRAAQIDAAVHRTATRCRTVPVTETVALRLLVMLGREISALLEQALRPHGLNDAEFRTLMMLFSQPDGVAHPGELCASAAQSPASMTRVTDGLCGRGLITRLASDQDRRRTILRITPAGEALARELMPRMDELTAGLFSSLQPAERTALLAQLRVLLIALDRRTRESCARELSGTR